MHVTPFPAVDALLGLAGPPRSAAPIDWVAIQRRVGSVLPADYRSLVERTGPLRVGDFVTVFAPGASNPNADLLAQMGRQLGALHDVKQAFADVCPYPLWFEPGGLLPWGCSDNGDGLYWLTRAHPDQWTIVVGEARGPRYEEHPLSACDFLAGLAAGTIRSELLRGDAGAWTSAVPV